MPKEKPVNELTKYQTSESVVMPRSEIRNAPYNPRKISEQAMKALKANLKKVGLLGGVVVNKTTGNLVSGHQRLSALDSLEKSKDYMLRVELVEMDETTEKEQNIFMNSSTVQGEFDLDMLRQIVPEIDYINAGLSESDLHIIGIIDEIEDVTPHASIDEMNELYSKRKQDVKDAKRKSRENYGEMYETEPIVTLSFSTTKSKQEFMIRFGYDRNAAFIDGELFSERVEIVD